MRLPGYLACVFASVALAGCGDDGGGSGAAWTVDDLVDKDDATLVSDFNAYAASVDEPWERSPALVVAELYRVDDSGNPNVSIVSEAPPEGAETATVAITFSRLLDDSVEAKRSEVTLVRDGETWRVETIDSSTSCKPGRGHQGFSDELCV